MERLINNTKPIAMVTGGAGFIGSHLCDAIIQKGWRVVCYDDLSHGFLKNISQHKDNPDFSFIEADVCDINELRSAMKDISIIYHLAARKIPRYGDALSTLQINNHGTMNIFEVAAENSCKVILASTSDVYGKGTPPFSETSDLVLGPTNIGRWSYATSKIFDEHLAFAYYRQKRVPIVILRFFGSYGPRHHRSWWGGPQSVFIDQALKGEEITVHGTGNQTRSFTYIDDLIAGIVMAGESDKAIGEIINLGSDEEVTILFLAELISRLVDNSKQPKIKFVPYESFEVRYEDVMKRFPDLSKAAALLGYKYKTRLVNGLIKTIEWHRLEHDLPITKF